MGFGGSDDIAGRLEGIINEAAKAFAQSRADGREVASEIDNMTESAERFNDTLDGSVERMGSLKEETRIIGRGEYFSEMLSSIKEVKSSLGDISGLLKSDFKNALNGIAGAARFTIETLNTMDKTLTNIEGKQSNNVFDLSGMFKQTNKEEVAAYKDTVTSYVKTVLSAYDELMRLNSTGKGGYNQSVFKIAGINTAEYAKLFAEFRPAVEKIESSLNLTNSFSGLDRKVKEVHAYAAALEGLFRIANEKGVASFDLEKILMMPTREASTAERVTETMTSLADLKNQVEDLNRSRSEQAPVEAAMAGESEILGKLNELYELHKSAVEAAAKAEQEKLEASEKLAEVLSRERTVVQTVSESSEQHVEALAREEEQAKSTEEAEQARTESLVVAANTQMEAAKQASLAAQQEEDAGNRSLALIKQESEAQEEYNDIILDAAEKKKIGAGAALAYSEAIEGQFRDIEDMAELQGRSNQLLLEGAQAEEKAAESTRKANAAAEESNEVRQRGIEINQDFENSLNGQSEELDEMEASARQYDNALTQVNNTLKNVQKAMHTLEGEKGGTGRAEYAELLALERELQDLKDAGHDQDYEGLIDAIARLKNGMSGALQTMNLFTTAEKDAAAAAKENENAARSIEKLIEKYSLLQNKSDEVTQKMLALEQAQRALNNAQPGTEARKTAMEAYRAALDDATRAVKAQADAEKEAAADKKKSEDADRKKQGLLRQLNTLYGQCADAEKKYASASRLAHNKESYRGIQNTKAAILELLRALEKTDVDLDKVAKGARSAQADFAKFNASIKDGTRGLSGWVSDGLDQLKSRLTYSFGLAAMAYKAANEIKKMVSVAIDLDTAMNQLQIVTRSSGADMDAYANRVSAMAKETGQATKDLIDATTVYARLGYTMDESASLAKYTAMLQGVGDIGASEAQDAMTAIIKAFGKNVDDVEDVMNKMVVVGNNFPISVSQIAEGMNNAGSMLAVANNSLDESIALLTAANTTVQDISKASTGLRTIAARIRKTTTEEDGDEAINEAKYEEMLGILTKHQVTLTEINGEYRSTYDVIKDIAGVWDKLTSMEQAAVTEALAGTRQQNVFSSLITQFQEAERAVESMKDSAGELDEAYSIYLDSIQAHVNTLKAAYDELARDFVDSDFAKYAIDFLTKIIELLDLIVEKLGAVPAVITAIGVPVLLRNIGDIFTGIKSLTKAFAELRAAQTVTGVLTEGASKLAAALEFTTVILGVAALAGALVYYKKVCIDAFPSAEKLSKEFNEAKKEADDLQKKIDTNNERIRELSELKGTSGWTSELENEKNVLEEENAELQEQLDLLRDIEQYKKDAMLTEKNRELGFFFQKGRTVEQDTNTFRGSKTVRSDEGLGGALNAIDDYQQALERLEELEQRRRDHDWNNEVEANVLKSDIIKAENEVIEYRENLESIWSYLQESREMLFDADDEESVKNLTLINELITVLAKPLGKSDKTLKSFKDNLLRMDKAIRGKLIDGLELTDDELEEFIRWLNACGYSMDEFEANLRDLSNQMHEGDSSEETYLTSQISQWGTMTEEIVRATDALAEYQEAMKGGSNDEIAKGMQEAWKKAREDIESGRIDSKAVWAFANMAMTPEQLAALGYDARRIAEVIKSNFFSEMFDDSNADNGFSDDDNKFGYGQRFLKYLEDHQNQLPGVQVWRDADGQLKYIIDDFSQLAKTLNMSEGLIDALLYDLDAYGAELLTDTKQNTDLVNSLKGYIDNIGDAKEATKAFIEEAIRGDANIDDGTLFRILYGLHDQGHLSVDPSEYLDLIHAARDSLRKKIGSTEGEEDVTVQPRGDDTLLVEDIDRMLENAQKQFDRRPLKAHVGIENEELEQFKNEQSLSEFFDFDSYEEGIGQLHGIFQQLVTETGDVKDATVAFVSTLRSAKMSDEQINGILNAFRGMDENIGSTIPTVEEVNEDVNILQSSLKDADNTDVNPDITVNTTPAYNAVRSLVTYLNDVTSRPFMVSMGINSFGDKVSRSDAYSNYTGITGKGSSSRAKGGVTGKAGPTLVNELGPELLSDRGRAFIANHGEPGFVNLSKDAIVFTAEETKEIVKKGGLVSGAHAYADGTRKGLIGRLIGGDDVPARATITGWICKICGRSNPSTVTKCRGCGNAKGASNTSAAMAMQKAQQQANQQAKVNSTSTTVTTTSSSRWNCNICHFSNPQTAVKCQRCGAVRGAIPQNVPETKTPEQTFRLANGTYWTCSNCGRTNSTSVNYCASCGKYRFSTNVTTIPGNPSTGWKAPQSANYNELFNFGDDGSAGGGGGGGAASESRSNPQKIDWIAVKLNRIQREISDLEKVASSGLKKLSTRLDAAKNEASKLNEEIGIAKSGYDRYMQEANSVGLRSDLAEKVRNGAIDINEYDDEELRQQIQEYQEWLSNNSGHSKTNLIAGTP